MNTIGRILQSIKLLVLFAGIIFLASCMEKQGADEPLFTTRTVLVYMVANNDLNSYAQKDIAEMKEGMRQNIPKNCRWLVYYTEKDQKSRLIEIDRNGEETVLLEYLSTESSVSVSRMKQVIDHVKLFTAPNHLGLVLWSHATGWLNEENSMSVGSEAVALPLSFGYDGEYGKRMKIKSLAEALRGTRFEFIYFDCCHMATTEVAYELNLHAGIMVASATELELDGMPYDKNVVPLLKGDCMTAAQNSFKFYSDRYAKGWGYGCTISVFNLLGMQQLAGQTYNVLRDNALLPDDYRPVKYFRSWVVPGGLYDFNHYIKALCGNRQEVYAGWKRAFDNVVVFHKTTPTVFDLDARDFSGMATNIVRSADEMTPGNDIYGYRETAWWKDVVSPAFE